MSFTKQPILLPNTRTRSQPLKLCDKCGMAVDPEGGVNMSPAKWVCAACWQMFNRRRSK